VFKNGDAKSSSTDFFFMQHIMQTKSIHLFHSLKFWHNTCKEQCVIRQKWRIPS
jgi:hypothetical protein